jgi:hypothetical protein
MAVDAMLGEPKWKKDGLTKRTAQEQKQFKKTGVSEALRDYAKAEALGLSSAGVKKTKLQAVNTALKTTATNHKANGALVALITQMELAVKREVTRINQEINNATLDGVMGNKTDFAGFLAHAKNLHCEENVEFLRDVKAGVAAAKLIPVYITTGSPKEVNVDAKDRNAWASAPANDTAKQKVVNEVITLVTNDTLAKYKNTLKIVVT